MTTTKSKPKRRLRYKGTHPRKFSEKYKELNQELYVDDVEKIKLRGATPAGTHRPICVEEILEILNPQPGETVLDVTLGYGGHSTVLLKKLLPGGRLIGLDQDPIELPKTEERLRLKEYSEESLVIGAVNFKEAQKFLVGQGIGSVDMILADLGVSSMQIDDPVRGFSFKTDAPLDLRMNPKSPKFQTAANLILKTAEDDLAEILFQNSDELNAKVISHALKKHLPQTTIQLATAIRNAIPKVIKKEGDAPVRRVFQALRIEVNDEFGALESFLADIPKMLSKKGRVAILSFHSGEDRRVKKSFQGFLRKGIYSSVAENPIRPHFEEQRNNPRSKSAKLRWAKI